MNNKVFKRIVAYVVDMLVVVILTSMISQIRIVNKSIDQYETVASEYWELLNSDELENIEQSEIINLTIKLDKAAIGYYVIDFIVIMLYFTLFPFFNKNRTIGMHLMKLEINANKGLKSFLLRSFLVPIYSGGGFTLSAGYICLIPIILFTKGYLYVGAKLLINLGLFFYSIFDIVNMIRSNAKSSLHDKISSCEIVSSNN